MVSSARWTICGQVSAAAVDAVVAGAVAEAVGRTVGTGVALLLHPTITAAAITVQIKDLVIDFAKTLLLLTPGNLTAVTQGGLDKGLIPLSTEAERGSWMKCSYCFGPWVTDSS